MKQGFGLALLLVLRCPVTAYAGGPPKPSRPMLRVFTKTFSPLIYGIDDAAANANGYKVVDQRGVDGYSAGVMRHLAKTIEFDLEWYAVDSVTALMQSVMDCTNLTVSPCDANIAKYSADIAIAGITINAERQLTSEFTHAYVESGLIVMWYDDGELNEGAADTQTIVGAVFSQFFAQVLLVLGLSVIVGAHLVWLTERGRLVRAPYTKGIWDAMWWTYVMLMSAASKRPKGAFAQVLAIFLTLYGLILSAVLIGYFQLVFEEATSTENIPASLDSVSDLTDKIIGVHRGTSTEAFMNGRNLNPIIFETLTELKTALMAHRIDCVVYDAPPLWEICAGNPSLRCSKHPFGREYYGIAFPRDSRWAHQVDVELLRFMGTSQETELKTRHFGTHEPAYTVEETMSFPVDPTAYVATQITLTVLVCVVVAITCFLRRRHKRAEVERVSKINAIIQKNGVGMFQPKSSGRGFGGMLRKLSSGVAKASKKVITKVTQGKRRGMGATVHPDRGDDSPGPVGSLAAFADPEADACVEPAPTTDASTATAATAATADGASPSGSPPTLSQVNGGAALTLRPDSVEDIDESKSSARISVELQSKLRNRVKLAKLRVGRSSPDSIAAISTDALLDLDLDSPDNDADSAAGVPVHDDRAAAEAKRDAMIEQLHDDMHNLTMHVKAISNSLVAMQNEWD